MSQYLEQLNRVRRFLKRIEKHGRSAVDYDDDMWSFFQNCWHLKDWIINDDALPKTQSTAVVSAAHECTNLRVCADLANSTKHLKLTQPKVGAKHHHKNYVVVVGGPENRVEYLIDPGTRSLVDGLTLAKDCVADWERILSDHGLPIGP